MPGVSGYMNSNTETSTFIESLNPWIAACIAFFLALVVLIPPSGNWLISGIATLLGALPILVFCIIGTSILKRVKRKKPHVILSIGFFLGLVFGILGYAVANLVAYFEGLIAAFFIAGITAGVLAAIFRVTANKRMQSDAAMPPHR